MASLLINAATHLGRCKFQPIRPGAGFFVAGCCPLTASRPMGDPGEGGGANGYEDRAGLLPIVRRAGPGGKADAITYSAPLAIDRDGWRLDHRMACADDRRVVPKLPLPDLWRFNYSVHSEEVVSPVVV